MKIHIEHTKVNTAGTVRLTWLVPKGTDIQFMRARNDTTRDEWVGIGLATQSAPTDVRYLVSGVPNHESELTYSGPSFKIDGTWQNIVAVFQNCGANDDLALIVGYN